MQVDAGCEGETGESEKQGARRKGSAQENLATTRQTCTMETEKPNRWWEEKGKWGCQGRISTMNSLIEFSNLKERPAGRDLCRGGERKASKLKKKNYEKRSKQRNG